MTELRSSQSLRFSQRTDELSDRGDSRSLRSPELIEVTVDRCNFDCVCFDVLQAGAREQRLKCLDTRIVGAGNCRRIDADSAQGFHQRSASAAASSEIPNVASNKTAGLGDTSHFGKSTRPIRQEIDDQRGRYDIERAIGERQLERVGHFEISQSRNGQAARVFDLLRKWVHTDQTRR